MDLCKHPPGEGDQPHEAITDEHEQRVLLRLLHDLGVVVAYGVKKDASAAMRETTAQIISTCKRTRIVLIPLARTCCPGRARTARPP